MSDFNIISKDFEKLLKSMNYIRLFKAIGEVFKWGTMEQFRTEGKYFGGRKGTRSFGYKWFDLAPRTVKERTRKGYVPINILQQTAILRNSFTYSNVTTSGFLFGTNVPYAPFLHYGTKNIPPRPILPERFLPADFEDEIKDIIENFIRLEIPKMKIPERIITIEGGKIGIGFM